MRPNERYSKTGKNDLAARVLGVQAVVTGAEFLKHDLLNHGIAELAPLFCHMLSYRYSELALACRIIVKLAALGPLCVKRTNTEQPYPPAAPLPAGMHLHSPASSGCRLATTARQRRSKSGTKGRRLQPGVVMMRTMAHHDDEAHAVFGCMYSQRTESLPS
jgi:hypothetical protein